jgi:hypothetical protein
VAPLSRTGSNPVSRRHSWLSPGDIEHRDGPGRSSLPGEGRERLSVSFAAPLSVVASEGRLVLSPGP